MCQDFGDGLGRRDLSGAAGVSVTDVADAGFGPGVFDEEVAGVDAVEGDRRLSRTMVASVPARWLPIWNSTPLTLIPPLTVMRRVFSGSSAPAAATGEDDGEAATSGRGGLVAGVASQACCGVTCPGSPWWGRSVL